MGPHLRRVCGHRLSHVGRAEAPDFTSICSAKSGYRTRSRFVASRQGKRELGDYVQELRTLIAGMAADPLLEVVTVTVFMEGLRTGVSRTEVFSGSPFFI